MSLYILSKHPLDYNPAIYCMQQKKNKILVPDEYTMVINNIHMTKQKIY